jgi:hypothetical protein
MHFPLFLLSRHATHHMDAITEVFGSSGTGLCGDEVNDTLSLLVVFTAGTYENTLRFH